MFSDYVLSEFRDFLHWDAFFLDLAAILLIGNYLIRSRGRVESNPGMAVAFLLYILGHTIVRVWIVFTHAPAVTGLPLDVTSTLIVVLGLTACIRMLSTGTAYWVFFFVLCLTLAGVATFGW
jgi:hypothetical protein